jgi:hypothetical protein
MYWSTRGNSCYCASSDIDLADLQIVVMLESDVISGNSRRAVNLNPSSGTTGVHCPTGMTIGTAGTVANLDLHSNGSLSAAIASI